MHVWPQHVTSVPPSALYCSDQGQMDFMLIRADLSALAQAIWSSLDPWCLLGKKVTFAVSAEIAVDVAKSQSGIWSSVGQYLRPTNDPGTLPPIATAVEPTTPSFTRRRYPLGISYLHSLFACAIVVPYFLLMLQEAHMLRFIESVQEKTIEEARIQEKADDMWLHCRRRTPRAVNLGDSKSSLANSGSVTPLGFHTPTSQGLLSPLSSTELSAEPLSPRTAAFLKSLRNLAPELYSAEVRIWRSSLP